jgi:hypothetical protein
MGVESEADVEVEVEVEAEWMETGKQADIGEPIAESARSSRYSIFDLRLLFNAMAATESCVTKGSSGRMPANCTIRGDEGGE